jgi:DNA ligase (NAD+)
MSKPTTMSQIISEYKTKGTKILSKLTETQLNEIIKQANQEYYSNQYTNSSNVIMMTDNEYDILLDYTANKFPYNAVVKEGHTIISTTSFENTKVQLPYQMWSMDKIKPDTDALLKWTKKYKGQCVLSCKLDGISALYSTETGSPKLYTRGNGIIGQDISHLIPYLNINKLSSPELNSNNLTIRGEIIISKHIFKTKYASQFANPRNFVAGLVNTKKPEKSEKNIVLKYKDLTFVAYELIAPKIIPSKQFEFLKTLEKNNLIETVEYYVLRENEVTNEFLSKQLIKWRKEYQYEIDGVICMNDKMFPRKDGNPEHAFAFKMVLSDQMAEAKVVDVLWTPSKDGYLKPRVKIEPIILGGVKIEYATGFNAKFIKDNSIGIGALVGIIRSGDVIPHIIHITQKASHPLLPSEHEHEYKWNETGIDIILIDKESDETVIQKNITGFFTGIEVEGLSSGNIKRLIQAGYDSIPKIISMEIVDYLKIDGFKEKLASKIKEGITAKLKTANLPVLMNASNLLGRGFGVKKIKLILDIYPTILTSNHQLTEKNEMLKEITGMAEKTSLRFVENIKAFTDFMKEIGMEYKLYSSSVIPKQPALTSQEKSHVLFGKKYVMTGFRDKELISALEKVGAIQSSSINKNTFMLIVKTIENKNDNSVKIKEAIQLEIPIISLPEFKKKYEFI